jgi:hypothetical protein
VSARISSTSGAPQRFRTSKRASASTRKPRRCA